MHPLWPAALTAIPILKSLLRQELAFTDKIVLACFVLFVLALALDIGGALQAGGLLNFLSPSGQALYKLGMGGALPLAQGRWRIGYTRAARLVETMEARGIVGPPEGATGTREILDYGDAAPPVDDL